MKSLRRQPTDLARPLLVVSFLLLCLLGATQLAGFGAGETTVVTARPPAPPRPDPVAALRRAAEYLWSKQAEDGGWHSEKYGLLRSGQALTPFVLHALLMIPEEVQPRDADDVERALAFIRRHTNQDGVLGVADPDVLEYPNYATAYALRCLETAGAQRDEEHVRRMRSYLQSEQFSEARGIGPESPAFGGWGFGGKQPAGKTGHMDLAHSRRVLQALRESGVNETQLYQRAERFLRVVQRQPVQGLSQPGPGQSEEKAFDGDRPLAGYDGGFFFSPIVLGANKGRETHDTHGAVNGYRSYATATCDGILSLLACGVELDDRRLNDAKTWLVNHPRFDYPEGVPTAHPEPWGEAIHFYHLAARAEVYRNLDWPGAWRSEVHRVVVGQQRGDGSFVNDQSHLMKEDDPFLCTALACTALTNALP